jgi:hypothetical protein
VEAGVRETAADRARALITFADGLEASGAEGIADYARRARTVADDLLRVLDALRAERSARVAMQKRCERQQELLGRRVLEAIG